jgi:hypothetical protein
MRYSTFAPVVASVLLIAATAAIYVLALKPAMSNQELFIIPAVEENIKIQPINISCAPLATDKAVYSRTHLICEKRDGQWVSIGDDLNCIVSEDLKTNEAKQISISGYPVQAMTNPCRDIDGKRSCKRASSLYTPKSCNNDI